jgi:hypothetical protein
VDVAAFRLELPRFFESIFGKGELVPAKRKKSEIRPGSRLSRIEFGYPKQLLFRTAIFTNLNGCQTGIESGNGFGVFIRVHLNSVLGSAATAQ